MNKSVNNKEVIDKMLTTTIEPYKTIEELSATTIDKELLNEMDGLEFE